MSPGAVPFVCSMTVAPTGTSAWRRLFAGMARPRAKNSSSMRRTSASWRTRGTPITSAIASRVMSSWVGPRPPVTMTPSLRASAVRSARTIRSLLSPTAWRKCESTPAAASCSPSQAEFVSAIWPRRSSVPTATISILISASARSPGAVASNHLLCAPCVPRVLEARDEGEPASDPHGYELEGSMRSQWGDATSGDRQVLDECLYLRGRPSRHRDAAMTDPGPIAAHEELPEGDQHDRCPWEPVLVCKRDERTDDHGLVG